MKLPTETNEHFYVKKNVSLEEYEIHKYAYDLHIVNIPKIVKYDKKKKVMTMERIGTMNISDFYGGLSDDIPDEIFTKVRNTIKKLYDHNILYIDITGYNFIEHEDDIWIIDFEHAKKINKADKKEDDDDEENEDEENEDEENEDEENEDEEDENMQYVKRLLSGAKEWNPEFI
jgi:RIO-like serine/threonine protein kinase